MLEQYNMKIMETTKWIIDSTHSEFTFKVKKLMVTTVTGNLEVFEGEIETVSNKFELIKNINFKANVNSIKTDDAQRDEHLKSADFFDMEAYPDIKFSSKSYNVMDREIEGELTIRNITKPVVFDVDFSEKAAGGVNEQSTVGLSISGKVNRKDFGLSWNGRNKAGDIIVGDDVKLYAEVQFVKQTENANQEV